MRLTGFEAALLRLESVYRSGGCLAEFLPFEGHLSSGGVPVVLVHDGLGWVFALPSSSSVVGDCPQLQWWGDGLRVTVVAGSDTLTIAEGRHECAAWLWSKRRRPAPVLLG